MADLQLIAPQRRTKVSFAVEPAHNIVCSLWLLNAENLDFREWVAETAAKLSPEQLQTNREVCARAAVQLGGQSWPSFTAWLDHLDALDARAMALQDMQVILTKAGLHSTNSIDRGHNIRRKKARGKKRHCW